MKIWSANLYFGSDMKENLQLDFYFEKEEKEDYKANEKYNEWNRCDNWVVDTVPMIIKVTKRYGRYTVTQGFDRELSEKQQQKVKKLMIESLFKYIEREKQNELTIFNRNLKFIQQYKG